VQGSNSNSVTFSYQGVLTVGVMLPTMPSSGNGTGANVVEVPEVPNLQTSSVQKSVSFAHCGIDRSQYIT
jgi:hypothetical protein